MKAVEYSVSGIKCDAEGCDYKDEEARLEGYPQFLNKPCPQCGATLLTEADLAATRAIVATCDWLNSVLPAGVDAKRKKFRVNMDGSGIPVPEVIES